MKIKFPVIILIFILFNFLNCTKPIPTDLPLRTVLSKYFDAVNSGIYKDISDHLTFYNDILNQFGEEGTTKVAFVEAIDKINSQYEHDRDLGQVNFDKFGIIAVKTMGLGRGLYYITDNFNYKNNKAELTLSHSFNYDEMDYSVFPKGTTLFFLGCPLGKIYKIKTGEPLDFERKYLMKVKTKWYFKKDDNNKWKIEKMEVLKDTTKCFTSYKYIY